MDALDLFHHNSRPLALPPQRRRRDKAEWLVFVCQDFRCRDFLCNEFLSSALETWASDLTDAEWSARLSHSHQAPRGHSTTALPWLQ